MASTTKTMTTKKVVSSRALDFVYDPLYIVSSEKEQRKEAYHATLEISRLQCVPNFQCMFSTLPNYKGHSWQLVRKMFPPAKPDYRIVQQQQVNNDPEITGRNRFKYFNVQLPAYQHSILPAGLHLAAAAGGGGDSAADGDMRVSAAAAAAAATVSPPVAVTRSRGTQTDYRESEAQTDPYSPPYRVVDGDWAEELTVAALSWGQ